MGLMKSVLTARRVFAEQGLSGIKSALRYGYLEKWTGEKPNRLYGRLVELTGNVGRLDGCRFDLATPPVPTEIKSYFLCGTYERAEREAVRRFLDPALPVVELGAALGVVSCVTNQRLRDPKRHVVVEANPSLMPLLTKNRDRNGCEFEILHRAVGYDGATMTFYAHEDFLASSTERDERASEIEVEAVTLRSILEGRGFDRCTLICDIEGAEAELVRREPETLRERVALVIMELHAGVLGESGAQGVLDEFSRLGFRPVHTAAAVHVLRNEV